MRCGVEDLHERPDGRMDHGDPMHTFTLSEPLRLTLNARKYDYPDVDDIRLSLFLVAPDARVRCLARRMGHDQDNFKSWYLLDSAEFEGYNLFNLRMCFEKEGLANYHPADDPERGVDTLRRLDLCNNTNWPNLVVSRWVAALLARSVDWIGL